MSKMRNLQPYSHYCFSKISRTLFDFLTNNYWVSLFLRNNSLIFWTGVSCFSETLFYSTLFCYSLDPHWQTELQTEERIHSLCVGWRNFFSITTTKKKSSSCLSGGCAIVITTGKKSSSRLSGGCMIFITTGKKSSSHLSGRCTMYRIWM